MEDLIIKYIVGEASTEEKKQLANWLQASKDNQALMDSYQKTWEASRQAKNVSPKNTEAAWQQFQSKINEHTAVPIAAKRPFRQIGYAAAALLIICLGIYFLQNNKATIYTNKDMAKVIALNDNSKITLNKNASLSTDGQFNKRNREVELQGEAFFEVAKNAQLPFKIKVANVAVQVIGTAFNIKSTEEAVEIAVESGIVAVNVGKQSFKLYADDQIYIPHNGQHIQQSKIENELYKYYRNNTFICNNTPLSALIASLEEAYHVQISIANKSLQAQLITGKYDRNSSIEHILSIVTMTLNAHYTFDGTKYIIE